MSEKGSGNKAKMPDWVRGPKEADLSKVSLEKIRKAHKERGINVELDADRPKRSKVTKTVIKGAR